MGGWVVSVGTWRWLYLTYTLTVSPNEVRTCPSKVTDTAAKGQDGEVVTVPRQVTPLANIPRGEWVAFGVAVWVLGV